MRLNVGRYLLTALLLLRSSTVSVSQAWLVLVSSVITSSQKLRLAWVALAGIVTDW